jgi:hypothetical protein
MAEGAYELNESGQIVPPPFPERLDSGLSDADSGEKEERKIPAVSPR